MSVYAKRKKCHVVGNGTGKKSIQQAGRPPDRPRPGSRPAVSGGWPAPRPALAGLQAGGVWWGSGPQAGPGRAPGRRLLVGGRPPGRPRPGFRPGALLIPICRTMAGLQAGDPVCSRMLLFQTASFCGGVLIPLHLPRDNYHDQKKNTTIV